MSQITLTMSQASIVAPIGKNGKVSVNNEKAVSLLNSSDKQTIVSAALSSTGAVAKIAKTAILASVKTVDSYLSAPSLDGSDWGNLLTLLAGKYGVSCFNRASMKGKAGCAAFLRVVILDAETRFAKAETAKGQVKPMETIQSAQCDLDNVLRLIEVAEQERIAANSETVETA